MHRKSGRTGTFWLCPGRVEQHGCSGRSRPTATQSRPVHRSEESASSPRCPRSRRHPQANSQGKTEKQQQQNNDTGSTTWMLVRVLGHVSAALHGGWWTDCFVYHVAG